MKSYERLQPEHLDSIRKLGQWDEQIFQNVKKGLGQLEGESTRLDLLRELSARAQEAIDNVDLSRLIDALLSIAILEEPDTFDPSALLTRLKDASDRRVLATWSSADCERAVSRVAILLRHEAIRVVAKASDVASEASRRFRDARIFIDLRPVYGDDLDSPPDRFVMMHTLKLEYVEDDSFKDLYVSLSADDLKKLEQLVVRERAKLWSLNRLIQGTGGKVIDSIEPREPNS